MENWLLTITLILTVGRAYAQTAPIDRPSDAESLLDHGISLREHGQDAAALEVFKQARDLCHCPRAQAQVGLAEQAVGQWVEAEADVNVALSAVADPWIEKHRAALEGALKLIAQHLGSLEVHGVAGAEIWVGGKRVATLPMMTPVRVVAGTSMMEVRAAGYVFASRPLVVQAGGLAQESVELAEVPKLTIPVPVSVVIPVLPPAPTPAQPRSLRRTLGYVGIGVAALFVAGGFAAYAVREEKVGIWNDNNQCQGNDMTRSQHCGPVLNAGLLAQDLEIAGFVVGGAAAVASAVLLARPQRKDHVATAIDCGGGPGLVGIACGTHF